MTTKVLIVNHGPHRIIVSGCGNDPRQQQPQTSVEYHVWQPNTLCIIEDKDIES